MFEIDKTLSFNTDKLVDGNDFDYVTRTSFNQGILRQTGFVNSENINLPGTWSLGLLQMDFFYRSKPWYAGQFVRKITPKFDVTESNILFFSSILNGLKPKLLSVLVRSVDKVFIESTIYLPTKNGEIDFEFMESFVAELEAQRVAELEAQRVAELEAYLTVTGLKDYELTEEEKNAINSLDTISWKEKNIVDVFDVNNTKSILSRDVIFNSGSTPYLCASRENNSIASYIEYSDGLKDKGDCIFIGGKTFVVTYQKEDFYSNDSHNLALYLKEKESKSKTNQLFLLTCIRTALSHLYSWGNSISKQKIKNNIMLIPVHNDCLDINYMETLIRAVQKLVIKDVVCWADKKIEAAKQVIEEK